MSYVPPSMCKTAVRDVLIGLAVVAGLWLTVFPDQRADRPLQLFLAAFALIFLLIRPWRPLVAVTGTALATGAAWVFGVTADPFVLTGLCVFVLAERRGMRRYPWWLIAAAVVLLSVTLGFSSEGFEERFRAVTLSAVILTASWVFGVRTRQALSEAAARSREQERHRLARDVHDVLSHSLGSIGVRAGIAAHVLSLGEDALRVVLHDVEVDARASLGELKTLMQRERSKDVDNAVPSLPLASLLSDIARTAESSGLITRLQWEGDLDVLSTNVRTTVHRVVQEAVTNTIRHAHATSVDISVVVSPIAAEVKVHDDGRGSWAVIHDGYGLTGMRERVALVGGSLHLEQSPNGFRAEFKFPLLPSPPGKL